MAKRTDMTVLRIERYKEVHGRLVLARQFLQCLEVKARHGVSPQSQLTFTTSARKANWVL